MSPPDNLLVLIGDASLRASVLILLLLAFRPWLRRVFGGAWVSLLWLVVLARLLMPRSVESASHPFAIWPPVVPMVESAGAWQVRVTVSDGLGKGTHSAAPAPVRPGLNRQAVSFWIWAAGAVGAFLCFGARSWHTSGLLRRAAPAADPRLQRLFLAIPERFRRRAVLHITDEIPVAALVGIWRPRILLPREWVAVLDDDELRHVLLHELGHARRCDLAVQWLFALAQCFHWFNPLVWLVARWARADAELACDAWVLAHSAEGERERYGDTLLKTSQLFRSPISISPVAIGMAASRHALVSRVRHVGTYRQVAGWRVLLGSALAGLVAIPLMTRQTSAQAPRLEVKEAAAATPAPTPSPAGGKPDAEAKPAPAAPEPQTKAAATAPHNEAKPTLIEIESKFLEVSESTAKKLGLMAAPPDPSSTIGGSGKKKPVQAAPTLFAPHSVLSVMESSAVMNQLIEKLNSTKGVDLLSAPRLTIKSGQKGTIEIIREFRYPTEWDVDKQSKIATPTAFETRNLGVTLIVESVAGPEGILDLTLSPEVVELEGFVNPKDGQPVPLRSGRSVGANMNLKDFSSVKYPKDTILQPIFSTRKITTSVSLMSGQSILLGGLKRDDQQVGNAPITRVLYILVTARIANPAALIPEAAQAPSPVDDVPEGVAEEGKPGFVRSPFSPKSGLIDIRGFPAGTKIACPYSGKVFKTP
ncbi:MAG: M56 family metallopeptidase [Chthoniobacter sp.]|uniref:M56 family metallopeptidase n=1 Tax=Chthoniobacter sp. TaxID=2510640 RepID=UPI0032A17F03